MSRLFSFELELQAENTTNVDFDKLIGQKVSFGMQGADPGLTPRHFHGIVVEMVQGSRDARLTTYSMTVAPEIWKLSCKYRSRIFQHIKFQTSSSSYSRDSTWPMRSKATSRSGNTWCSTRKAIWISLRG